jgi:predicted nucleotidyltransferase component of viral defense system
MHELGRHEVFEIEVLDDLQRAGFLRPLVFGGGTMLRLCHELPRYSVDLDFWFSKKIDCSGFHMNLKKFFSREYQVTDVVNKHFTLLYELRGRISSRKLKIEIRKELLKTGLEDKIAYSSLTTKQVLLTTLSLEESAKRKILAIRARDEIRDYFDLEFLLMRGASVYISKEDKVHISERIQRFKPRDYSVTLGSLLEKPMRDHYIAHGFSYLLRSLPIVE